MGADVCLMCHGQGYPYPVLDIFDSRHGVRQDKRSPFGQLQCESCHGPQGNHPMMNAAGSDMEHMRNFGKKSREPAEAQNDICLGCHRDKNRYLWPGSAHEVNRIPCATCHVIHTRKDPMQQVLTQIEICTRCHVMQRAQIQMTSSHPIKQGLMGCSECHNPHGSVAERLIKTNNVNQLCFECHAEKRGPFLWAHAPVSEDCMVCHKPHGSNHKSLLIQQAPFLCQQCHSITGHSDSALTVNTRAEPTKNFLVFQRACLNCHSMIHGSNHPSGVKLMR